MLFPANAATNINTCLVWAFFREDYRRAEQGLNGNLKQHGWRCTPELWPHLYKLYVAKTQQCFTSKKLQILSWRGLLQFINLSKMHVFY